MASLSTIYSESSESHEPPQPIIVDSAPPRQTLDYSHTSQPRPLRRPYGRYSHSRHSVYGYGGSTSRLASYDQPDVVTAQSLYGSRPASRNSNQDPWLPIDPYSSGSHPAIPQVFPERPVMVYIDSPASSSPSSSPWSSVQPSVNSAQPSSSGSSSSSQLPLPVTVILSSPNFQPVPFTFLHFVLRQLYLAILLWMPSHYFSRITRVFLEAELSVPDVKDMSNAVEDVVLDTWYVYPEGGGLAPPVSPALGKFRILWEDFIVSMKSDWKSANIVTVLLLGALLTMLQIEGIEGDPVARTGVLLSLVCALMSLLYGSIYMARFGMMNRLYKAAAWAAEARRVRTPPWWNVWIFLALPAIWLAWSIIFFTASILSYVWRTGSTQDPKDPVRLVPLHELGPRIGVSFLFVIGLLYLVLVLRTLRRFGSSMDDAWRSKTNAWRTQKAYAIPDSETGLPFLTPFGAPANFATGSFIPPVIPVHGVPPVIPRPVSPLSSSRSSVPSHCLCLVSGPYRNAVKETAWRPRSFNQLPYASKTEPFSPFEILDLSTPSTSVLAPHIHFSYHVSLSNWEEFTNHVKLAWAGMLYIPNMSTNDCFHARHLVLQDLVDTWNAAYFLGRHLKVSFSLPLPDELDSNDEIGTYEAPELGLKASEPPVGGPILYLSYVKARFDTSKSRFFPFLSPSHTVSFHASIPRLTDLYDRNSRSSLDSLSALEADDFIHPSTTDPLEYQDAPGPYSKALEVTGSFPSLFYRKPYPRYQQNSRILPELRKYNLGVENSIKVLGISDLQSEAWERLTIDLRRVLSDQFPIPNVSPHLWTTYRSLLIADLLATWNVKYFLKRGIEVVLDSGSSTRSDFGPRMPYTIHLDSVLHGLSDAVDVSSGGADPDTDADGLADQRVGYDAETSTRT